MSDNLSPIYSRKAGIWTRWCAWSISAAIYGCIIYAILWAFMERLVPFLVHLCYAYLPTPQMGKYLIPVILLLIYFICDAGLCAIFGNTVGKALLGIRAVRMDGSALSFANHLKRNMIIYGSGFACGLPGANTIAHIRAYRRYKRTGSTLWDDHAESYVTADSARTGKTVTYMVLTFLIVIGLLCAGLYDVVIMSPKRFDVTMARVHAIQEAHLNASLPRRIDDNLVLSHISLSNQRRTYDFIMEDPAAESLLTDHDRAARVKRRVTAAMAKDLCPSRHLSSSPLKEWDLVYAYHDPAGHLLYDVLIDEETCEHPPAP